MPAMINCASRIANHAPGEASSNFAGLTETGATCTGEGDGDDGRDGGGVVIISRR